LQAAVWVCRRDWSCLADDWDALGLALCALLTAGTVSASEVDPASISAVADEHIKSATI